MMPAQDDNGSARHIEASRRVFRKAAGMCNARGASIEDVAIAAAFAAFDIAEQHAGQGLGAVEWLRTTFDVLERAAMKGVRRQNDA